MSNPQRRSGRDSAEQHRNWLDLVEIDGPFLTLPVLLDEWPNGLVPVEPEQRKNLRREHSRWQRDASAGRDEWVRYILADLLGWKDTLRTEDLEPLTLEVAEHDTHVRPSFVLTTPEAAADTSTAPGGEPAPIKAGDVRLLGLALPAGQVPTARVRGESWSASPVDRLAKLCRHHDVELGLATDGRWWVLVWAPRGGVTTTVVFDSVLWPDKSEQDVLYAFVSLLNRIRFFKVREDETLVRLLSESQKHQEDVTEALGVQVRQAVELLVTAIGRADSRALKRGKRGLSHVDAHEVYRGAVSVMMRVVFLLFAEERGLLPSDNDLYARAYSAGKLYDELDARAKTQGSNEDSLANTSEGWHRLLSLFHAVYYGVEHPRLHMHAHDGSLFNPESFPWLPLDIDDRTVLHMLKSVQYVQVGRGRKREPRKLSFRALDVEQIGYVYEGLLSFEAKRATELVVGLIGEEGVEEEVPLRVLEELAAGHTDVKERAKALADKYKASGIGAPEKLAKALAPMTGEEKEQARNKLRGVVPRGEFEVTERLLPFFRLIRTDLRGLPMLVRNGELYVTESLLRKNTGTHYTPKFLAEEVVEGALEPLVYEPGPLQTADTSEWKLKSSHEILDLKVADIAVGSAAFLVAAARYLGDRLIEAWTIEGDSRVEGYEAARSGLREDDDPVVIEARRQIIEHCLYGVDINPMAVEMAKLSLWLVSMDPKRPFTFLDDRLAAGDSLLGVTSLEQIEYMHMDPKKGRELHDGDNALIDFTAGIRGLVGRVAKSRRELTQIDGTTLEGLNRKRAMLGDAELEMGRLKLLADLTVGAALANTFKGDNGLNKGSSEAVELASNLDRNETNARLKAKEWLETDLPKGAFDRKPLHWPLTFPEVFDSGGFDAVIGNPPFMKASAIREALGPSYREFIISAIAQRKKGLADLVAYFTLQGNILINKRGQNGFIATNSLAQGQTQTVGIDQIIASGSTIRSAIRSEPWPTRAKVEYCAIWVSKQKPHSSATFVLDGKIVDGITNELLPKSRISGSPQTLAMNSGVSFVGSYLNGLGFTVSPEWAKQTIGKDSRYSDVLHPYLNGDDLNDSPDFSENRWAISFHGFKNGRYAAWTEEKSKSYPKCYQHVLENVKPERLTRKDPKLGETWWLHWRFRPAMHNAIRDLAKVIVLAQSSSTAIPALVDNGQVFDQKLIVFASDDPALFAFLASSIHHLWSIKYGSTLKADLSYTPTKVFQTIPIPPLNEEHRTLGKELNKHLRNTMLSRNSGLTKIYNMVFEATQNDPDIQKIRTIHKKIDSSIIRSYRWEDRIKAIGGLDHGFHKVGRGLRYTIGPAAQREVLDSLLEENHKRYAKEVAQGLHDKKKGKRKAAASQEGTLFDV